MDGRAGRKNRGAVPAWAWCGGALLALTLVAAPAALLLRPAVVQQMARALIGVGPVLPAATSTTAAGSTTTRTPLPFFPFVKLIVGVGSSSTGRRSLTLGFSL